jgi:hypothetical protein
VFHELGVRPALRDPSGLEDVDPDGIHYGAEPVPALLQCYLTTTSPFMPSCSWPSTGQYIS